MAFDTAGRAAVQSWIRPATIEIPPPLQDIMGWGADLCAKAAAPTYPCLIDERHIVAELYNMTNVPMAVWIDEQRHLVRPVEPTGASDGFRKMDRATFAMDAAIAQQGKSTRQSYIDALRDWVKNGSASRYALPPEQMRARIAAPSSDEAVANANFRLGQYLFAQGDKVAAQRYFDRARQLSPESWHFVRQALELVAVGNASSPEFFKAVDALGDRPYYPPIELEGKSG